MIDNPVAEQPSRGPASFQVLQANIEAASVIFGRPGDDLVNVFTYRDGKFTKQAGPGRPGVPIPFFVQVLQDQGELAALLDTLQEQVDHPPADRNLDLVALRAFVEVLAQKAGRS
ncbi:MAG: hypothetical protein WCF33_08540 [Pseudonocardiaceae bacterium]